MAIIYVRSTDGNNADNGSTWALAKIDLAGAAAIDAAGDDIYVSQAHAESTAAPVALALAGTLAAPVRIICANDAAQPPTSVSTAGTVSTTGANGLSINGCAYVYGLAFTCGSGASSATATLAGASNNLQEFEQCAFVLGTSASGQRINIGAGGTNQVAQVRWSNVDFSCSNAAQGIAINSCRFAWEGGALRTGTSTPTTNGLIQVAGRCPGPVIVSGVDFSEASSSLNLCSGTFPARVVFRNCKLPASWAGSLLTGTRTLGFRAEMYNCDSGDTNYRIQVEDYAGTITQEITIVRSGGASDSQTGLAWKMVSTADAEYPAITLDSPEIVRWNETTGSSITVTVEVITDNVTLKDDECWLEVQYLGTSGVPLGTFVSDAKADVLATAANQTTSSETWTTTGLTTPTKQKLSVTITPQEKGVIHAVVKLAKASTTVYVDPKLVLS